MHLHQKLMFDEFLMNPSRFGKEIKAFWEIKDLSCVSGIEDIGGHRINFQLGSASMSLKCAQDLSTLFPDHIREIKIGLRALSFAIRQNLVKSSSSTSHLIKGSPAENWNFDIWIFKHRKSPSSDIGIRLELVDAWAEDCLDDIENKVSKLTSIKSRVDFMSGLCELARTYDSNSDITISSIKIIEGDEAAQLLHDISKGNVLCYRNGVFVTDDFSEEMESYTPRIRL